LPVKRKREIFQQQLLLSRSMTFQSKIKTEQHVIRNGSSNQMNDSVRISRLSRIYCKYNDEETVANGIPMQCHAVLPY